MKKTPEQYDQENPKIWVMFQKFTLEAIEAGKKHYSSKSIFELIRWHTEVKAKNSVFKINNNYTPYYARKFEKKYPQYEGFFRKRTAKLK